MRRELHPSADLGIQATKAKVAVGLQRAHAEFLGQGEGLAVVCFGWLAAQNACKIYICSRREKSVGGGAHLDIDKIQRLVRQGQYEFSIHAQQERLEEDLDVTEIEAALMQGEILEAYPEDPRG